MTMATKIKPRKPPKRRKSKLGEWLHQRYMLRQKALPDSFQPERRGK